MDTLLVGQRPAPLRRNAGHAKLLHAPAVLSLKPQQRATCIKQSSYMIVRYQRLKGNTDAATDYAVSSLLCRYHRVVACMHQLWESSRNTSMRSTRDRSYLRGALSP